MVTHFSLHLHTVEGKLGPAAFVSDFFYEHVQALPRFLRTWRIPGRKRAGRAIVGREHFIDRMRGGMYDLGEIMIKPFTMLVVCTVFFAPHLALGGWTLLDDFNGGTLDRSKWSDESILPGAASVLAASGPDSTPALQLDMTAAASGKRARVALKRTPQLAGHAFLRIAFDMRIDPRTTHSFANGMRFVGKPDTITAEQYGASNWDSSISGQFRLNGSRQGRDADGSDRREQMGTWYHYEVEMTSVGANVNVYAWISSNPADYASATPIWAGSSPEGIGDVGYVLKFHNNSRGNPDSFAQNRGLIEIDNVCQWASPAATVGAERIDISNGDLSVQIDRGSGVLASLQFRGTDVLKGTQELWRFEDRQGRIFVSGSMDDTVLDVKKKQRTATLEVENRILKSRGISLRVTYFWENEILLKRVEVQNRSQKEYAFRAYSRTLIADRFRKDGLYYVPRGEYCVPAARIQSTRHIANQVFPGIQNQMVSIVDPGSGIVAASFPYRVNGRLTTVFSGGTPASYLKAGGWEIGAVADFLAPGETCAYDLAYYVFRGSPSQLIRHWIQLEEIRRIRKKIWKNIRVPEWLNDVGLVGFVYTCREVEADNFLPNARPLAEKLPGFWMVMQWGTSHAKLNIKGYGTPHPPQPEDIRWATRDLPRIRKEMPNVKMGTYRYYWALDDDSPEGRSHPEWRMYDRLGKTIYNARHRYARQPMVPGARQSCVDTTREWYEKVPMDFHYVDGTDGGFPLLVDWKLGEVPQWYDWHVLYRDIYHLIHSGRIPPHLLFCNGTPVSIGDAGFVEIGGNRDAAWKKPEGWRTVADCCELGKLWGPPQGFMCLLFWDRRTDLRYINHILAYGLRPNLAPGGARYTGSEGLDFCLPRIPYIKAAYAIRNSKLVYANLKPDWRMDAGHVETTMMRVGNSVRINVINHGDEPHDIDVSFNPLAITLAGKSMKLSHRQLIPPDRLVAAESAEVFETVRRWEQKIPERGRCSIRVHTEPKLLNIVILSPLAEK